MYSPYIHSAVFVLLMRLVLAQGKGSLRSDISSERAWWGRSRDPPERHQRVPGETPSQEEERVLVGPTRPEEEPARPLRPGWCPKGFRSPRFRRSRSPPRESNRFFLDTVLACDIVIVLFAELRHLEQCTLQRPSLCKWSFAGVSLEPSAVLMTIDVLFLDMQHQNATLVVGALAPEQKFKASTVAHT